MQRRPDYAERRLGQPQHRWHPDRRDAGRGAHGAYAERWAADDGWDDIRVEAVSHCGEQTFARHHLVRPA